MVEFLLRSDRSEAAQHAWALYVRGRCEGYPDSDHIFNGDFELDPTRSPFDWRFGDRPGFSGSIDDHVAYAGRRSARVSFDGTENVGWSAISESAFMPPGRYTFQAHVRTDGLTTDRGVFFGIVGTDIDVATEPMTGTSDWHLVEKKFQVPASAGLLEVKLTRNPSLKFANKIKGTVWIDDVKIAPAEAR